MINKKKHILLVAIIVFLLVFLFIISKKYIFSVKNLKEKTYTQSIQNGYTFYTPEIISKLNIDELLFYKIISNKTNQQISPVVQETFEKHSRNAFKRFYDSKSYIADLEFKKNLTFKVEDLQGKKIETINAYDYYKKTGNFYFIEKLPGESLFKAWNNVVLKALYCDKSGFDDQDFAYLKFMKRNDGSYMDTHILLALLFIEKNNCYEKKAVEKEKESIITSLIEAENRESEFSDLYAERIVFIYWSGYGNKINKEWIEKIKENQLKNYGWSSTKTETSPNAHTTGLALLGILYYIEGKDSQDFFNRS
jgi:hypothetical protein